MKRCVSALLVMLLIWAPLGAMAAPSAVSTIESHKHMGVASCSNSVCHGASQPFRDSNVLQNEFAVWQEFDPHAKAWQTLGSDASKPSRASWYRRSGRGKSLPGLSCRLDRGRESW